MLIIHYSLALVNKNGDYSHRPFCNILNYNSSLENICYISNEWPEAPYMFDLYPFQFILGRLSYVCLYGYLFLEDKFLIISHIKQSAIPYPF